MTPGQSIVPCGIDAIASSYEIFRCLEAADAMQRVLIQSGIRGIRIELSMPHYGGVGTLGSIYADEGRFVGQTIATNGWHVGIEVSGKVYDNNFHTACLGSTGWRRCKLNLAVLQRLFL